MKQKGKLIERVVLGMELPGEVAPGMPVVELLGQHRVLIENHEGVVAYSNLEIRIKLCYGFLSVCGTGLDLVKMSRQQLVITGCIDRVLITKERY